jgi:hypothetical protein
MNIWAEINVNIGMKMREIMGTGPCGHGSRQSPVVHLPSTAWRAGKAEAEFNPCPEVLGLGGLRAEDRCPAQEERASLSFFHLLFCWTLSGVDNVDKGEGYLHLGHDSNLLFLGNTFLACLEITPFCLWHPSPCHTDR